MNRREQVRSGGAGQSRHHDFAVEGMRQIQIHVLDMDGLDAKQCDGSEIR